MASPGQRQKDIFWALIIQNRQRCWDASGRRSPRQTAAITVDLFTLKHSRNGYRTHTRNLLGVGHR